MTDQPDNPYQPTLSTEGRNETAGGCFHRIGIWGIAVLQLGRGILSGLGLVGYSSSSLPFPAVFALIVGDAIYSVTGLLGGSLLFTHRPVGWWLSTLHWSWYLSSSFLLAITAEALGWQMPSLDLWMYSGMQAVLAISVLALFILYRRPVRASYRVHLRAPLLTLAIMFAGCYIAAVLNNLLLLFAI